ncbi:LOW QUALITY PROTEIN: hypothetical protein PHMEG_0006894 [Phytophthora megakarya]|uniref:Uncharacterized protein n=1 Tax=Phytophthora megakarya TaxID=4795 RepID=A0A225WMR3_9STRA|nr:LOW QUALITY PROTEIN: hypothetical protein PHMEG_0006894 [Phytophthora megakarya]
MSASTDICGIDVQALYLNDPGNKQEPVGYVLCSEMGNTCMKNGCSCRSASSAVVNGATKYFGVCVVLTTGADCVTSGDDYITCAVAASSTGSKESQNESGVRTSTTKANTESNTPSSKTTTNSTSGSSGSTDVVSVSSTAASASSMSTPVMIVIIVVAVVFVALVSWVVRSYCMRRTAAENKLASRRNRNRTNNFDATSPTNITGRSSATPSFPAFDRRTRAMQSPTSTSGRQQFRCNIADQYHGQIIGDPFVPSFRSTDTCDAIAYFYDGPVRDQEEDEVPHDVNRIPDVDGETRTLMPTLHPVELVRAVVNRIPRVVDEKKHRSLLSGVPGVNQIQDVDGKLLTLIQPLLVVASENQLQVEAGNQTLMQRLHRMDRVDLENQDENRLLDVVDNQVGNRIQDVVGATDTRKQLCEPHHQRAKHASPKPAARPNNAPEPSGGTVYTGRNTYERVAQFAQLAAFEAPPPPPPRPQKPIKPVPVANPVPKHARAPPPPRPARPPQRQGFHIDEDPVPTDYDILSPKTARSLAPSVASSATTIVAPGRNRPTPLQQNRRPQYSNATPSYYQSDNKYNDSRFDDSRFDESKYDESDYGDSRYDESGYEGKFKATNNYDDSFVSEVSSMAWSGASGLSDDSYYHAAPSNTARIPVIDAPNDDDDARSEDAYSDWGNSTQTSNAFRSTAASDASFFSVNSDFEDTKKSGFKEREF